MNSSSDPGGHGGVWNGVLLERLEALMCVSVCDGYQRQHGPSQLGTNASMALQVRDRRDQVK